MALLGVFSVVGCLCAGDAYAQQPAPVGNPARLEWAINRNDAPSITPPCSRAVVFAGIQTAVQARRRHEEREANE